MTILGLFTVAGVIAFFPPDVRGLQRREQEHRKNVQQAVDMLHRAFETTVELRRMQGKLHHDIMLGKEQRRDLATLMMRETQPSGLPGTRYDAHALLFQFTRLGEKKLKPLFDGEQWEIIKSLIPAFRREEILLRREGLLP